MTTAIRIRLIRLSVHPMPTGCETMEPPKIVQNRSHCSPGNNRKQFDGGRLGKILKITIELLAGGKEGSTWASP